MNNFYFNISRDSNDIARRAMQVKRYNAIKNAAQKIARNETRNDEAIECLRTEDVSDCISFVREAIED